MQTGHLRSIRLRKAIAQRATRSALYQWLHDNHDDITAAQEGNAVLNWEPLRAVATEEGIRDTNGREITHKKMKRLWHVVRKGYVEPKRQTDTPLSVPTAKAVPWKDHQAASGSEEKLPGSRAEVAPVASTERKVFEVPRSDETNR